MKKALTILCAFLIAITVSVSAHAESNRFSDVPAGHWAQKEIESFASKNIVNGIGNGSFAPDAGVTREQFCKMLVLTFNAAISSPASPSFSDVAPSEWSYQYVETSKNFLTGYANPFGGLPAFHPEEYATREDIAVALVRMMGLTEADASDPNYAYYKFSDGSSISPALLGYISVACEKGLINGCPDGTFGPTRGISRAETVVMLNRATKQAVTTIGQEIDVSASVVYSNAGKTATIHIKGETGISVVVNGTKIEMSNNGYGKYEGVYTHTFAEEGTKDFVITATKAGKTKTVNVTAKYEIGAPVLSITQCPATVSKREVTIKGTIKDSSNNVSLTINGESVEIAEYSGSWSKTYDIEDGENTFIIVGKNAAGKTVTDTRTVTCKVGGPKLVITECPTSATGRQITIKGTLTDSVYSVSLTINGESVSLNQGYLDGRWSKTYDLEEGENTFVIVGTNAAGKTVTETRTVTFNVGGPKLTITECPTVVTSKQITIKGTLKDTNYSVSLTINGESVSLDQGYLDGRWSQTYILNEGENTFVFVGTNAAGKTVTETRTVTFNVGGPKLTITECPTAVTNKQITIKGTLKDSNYSVSLTINGESVSLDQGYLDGRWSKTFTLDEGENTFVIVGTNAAGKTVTETRTVTFNVGSPEIIFTNCPEVTHQKSLYLQGCISGYTDGVIFYIDDQPVSLGYNKSFNKYVTLSDGDNTFVFRAVNSFGKTVTVEKKISFVSENSTAE